MSLYADYLKEREDTNILEDTRGFATYKITGEECYIIDIYVAPIHRGNGMTKYYSDKIGELAKELGCSFLSGTV